MVLALVGVPSPQTRGRLWEVLVGCREARGGCVSFGAALWEWLVRGRFQPLGGWELGSPDVPRGTQRGGLGMLLIGFWAVFFFILFFMCRLWWRSLCFIFVWFLLSYM